MFCWRKLSSPIRLYLLLSRLDARSGPGRLMGDPLVAASKTIPFEEREAFGCYRDFVLQYKYDTWPGLEDGMLSLNSFPAPPGQPLSFPRLALKNPYFSYVLPMLAARDILRNNPNVT